MTRCDEGRSRRSKLRAMPSARAPRRGGRPLPRSDNCADPAFQHGCQSLQSSHCSGVAACVISRPGIWRGSCFAPPHRPRNTFNAPPKHLLGFVRDAVAGRSVEPAVRQAFARLRGRQLPARSAVQRHHRRRVAAIRLRLRGRIRREMGRRARCRRLQRLRRHRDTVPGQCVVRAGQQADIQQRSNRLQGCARAPLHAR